MKKTISPMKKPIIFALLAFSSGILLAWLFLQPKTNATLNNLLNYQSKVLKEQATVEEFEGPVVKNGIGSDFTLQEGDGTKVSLSDFRGKAVVIYFGYTSCPDVCPTTLGVISGGLKTLSEEESAKVQPIFITLDPGRDKGEALAAYAKHFYPSFIGLTGQQTQDVQKVASRYRTFFNTIESSSYLGYLLHHTSKTYVVSSDGASVQVLPHDMSKEDVAKAVRKAL